MLRLLFKTNEEEPKQLTVITDGIDSQLNVFVTENTVGDIDYFESLGIVIEPGVTYNIGLFKEWCIKSALQLISYPEGLNETSQILVDVVEEWRFFLESKDDNLTFENTDDQVNAVITSYKQLYVNGEPEGNQEPLEITFETTPPFSVSKEGLVTVEENPTDQPRNGNLKVTQAESGKILNIPLIQKASVITYNYVLTTVPTSLSFSGAGETKPITINSTKQKVVNGVPSEETQEPVTIELAGVGFNYETSENVCNVTASENTSESQRTGTLTINQTSVGGKSVNVSLTQNAATITYDYTISVDPTELSFVVGGETKIFGVSSSKQKKINGKNDGVPISVPYTTVVSGTGFTKGTSEYSVVAEANTGAQRTGQAVVTMSEGSKTATVTLTQAGV